jgi:beta-glucosidase
MPLLSCFLLTAALLAMPALTHSNRSAGVSSSSAVSRLSTEQRQSIEAKIDALIAHMTPEQKAGQLSIFGANRKNLKELIRQGEVGGTNGVLPGRNVAAHTRRLQHLAMQSKLKIPLLFMGDVVHGFRTTFPLPIALAATWNPPLVRKVMHAAATEATRAGVNWTFAPMVDIGRDPRWGRVSEGAGADPYLNQAITGAAIRGFQGHTLAAADTMLATAKHFAGYGAVRAGRDYNAVNLSRRQLRAVYLPPFKAAVDEGVGSIMAAFIALNGVPATADRALLTGLLRQRWGFNGLLVSDYDAVPELQQLGVADSPAKAVELAINAGIDMDLHSGTYLANLPRLVRQGKVSKETLNAAVRRVLWTKAKLGLFDDPYRYGRKNGRPHPPSAAHRALARRAARQSMVLLKNSARRLPLKKNIATIAVIGPLANDKQDLLGPVHAMGVPEDVTTVLEGIRDAISPGTTVVYAKGTDIRKDAGPDALAAAVSAAHKADVAVLVLGESNQIVGEGDSRSRLGLPGQQLDLVKAIVATGTPVAVVLINGRALALPWIAAHVPAILDAWMPGDMGGPAIADVLFGKTNPAGKLPMSFPRDVGQVPLVYSHRPSGRPFDPGDPYTTRYVDVANTPLFPFGYGLSYTHFHFGKIHLSTSTMPWNDTLAVSVKLTNTGKRTGTEVVQLYIHDKIASVSPPVRLLRKFKRVSLAPGQSKVVKFHLNRHDLAIDQRDLERKAAPGAYQIFIGGDSTTTHHADFRLQAASVSRARN